MPSKKGKPSDLNKVAQNDATNIGHRLREIEKTVHDLIGDIDALRSVLEKEKQANLKYRLISNVFEKSNEAIIIADENYQITMVNKAFSLITSYRESEAIHENLKKFLLLNKQEDFQEAIEATQFYENEIWIKAKDGRKILIHFSMTQVRDLDNKQEQYIVIFQDVTSKHKNENKIKWMAFHDVLTGLSNQELFVERFNFTLSIAEQSASKLALIYIDIDFFKRINDTLGHSVGDKLLIAIGKRLKSMTRLTDSVSRRGGDEFALFLMDTDINNIQKFANRILKNVSEKYTIDNNEIKITVSIGISIYPDDGKDFESLYKLADMAMFAAKKMGRNCVQFSSQKLHESLTRELKLESELYSALQKKQFTLLYQPQMSLKDGHIVGIEALIRWNSPEFGIISPLEFIPIAERTGQIKAIGEWVLSQAMAELKQLMDSGFSKMTIAVNISAVQLRQPDFFNTVMNLIDNAGLVPQLLEFEITEGMLIDNSLVVIKEINKFKRYGVLFSLDDFGTGYSSLSYLKSFRVKKLKIDRSFITNVITDKENQSIVNSIIAMAKVFGMTTIAEGVETEEQLNYLRENGCDEMQGYYLAKPLSPDELKRFLSQYDKE